LNQHYTLDNAWTQARERLGLLEAVADPNSIRHLEALGIAEGWQCADVAAGGGSIAEWLCRRVGATGHVLATDIDTRFLDVLKYPNLEIRRHDIVRQPLPAASFDLVHARALLVHLTDRAAALRHMVEALKPGGWLLLEETDYVSMVLDPRSPTEGLAKGQAALRHFLTAAGFDEGYGRRLFGDVRGEGLVDLGAEGHVALSTLGTPRHQFELLSFAQFRDRLIQADLLTEAEADAYVAALSHEDFISMGPILMAVWGRRPSNFGTPDPRTH
jgi:SAM-dependent methyltransferase